MRYKGKPLGCEAFKLVPPQDKFHRWLRDKPEWFQVAYTTGAIQITITQKEMYATIYDGNNTRKANAGDMVVRNSYGRIFPMGSDEFDEAFEVTLGVESI